MDEMHTKGWEELKFPPILEHLQNLAPKESELVVDSAVEFTFGEWLQNVVLDHVRLYWSKFYFDWFKNLQQLLRDQTGLVDVAQYIFTIYEKAGKPQDWLGIKIAGEGSLSIWLTNDKFVLKEESDVKYFPILKGKENESIIRFGQALAHFHPVQSMKTKPEEILEYVKSNNKPEEHLDACWPDIVRNFMAALKGLKLANVIQINKSELLRSHSGKRPLQFQVIKRADLIIFFAYTSLIVFNTNTKESRSYNIDDNKQIDEFITTMRASAAFIYLDMPTNVQQVKQVLVKLNNLKNKDFSTPPPGFPPNNESDPTIQVS